MRFIINRDNPADTDAAFYLDCVQNRLASLNYWFCFLPLSNGL